MTLFRLPGLILTGLLLLAACENTPAPAVTPPKTDPAVPEPGRLQDRPVIALGAVSSTLNSVTVTFTVNAVSGTTLEKCDLTLGSKKQTLALGGVGTAVRTVTVGGLTSDTSYTLKLECTGKDAQGRLAVGSLSADARTLIEPPAPPASEGGNKAPFDPTFDPTLDYAWVTLEQITPAGNKETLRYLRGSFAVTDVLPEGYDYFLTTTVSNPGNAITGRVNSSLLAQGLPYTLIARGKAGSSEAGKVTATFSFVPDNLGPQGADVQPKAGSAGNGYLSNLSSALTSRYGNWVGGGARVGSFDPAAARFTLRLGNTRRLEDAPVPSGASGANPGGGSPQYAVGTQLLRYYALPVSSGFVGSLDQALKAAADGPLLLGERSSNDLSGDPALNNYPVTVQTLQGDSTPLEGVSQLGDGGSAARYALYAVAYDRLGNPSLNTSVRSSGYNAQGYPLVLINVDNAPPVVTAPAIKDRGPLDVHARGEGCERVDTALSPLAAPSDVFPAEDGFTSGCALISASVSDAGVGFDSAGVVNTSGTLISLGAPSSGFSSGRLALKITARGTAALASTTVNLNDLSGPQTFTLTNVSDLLGNVAEEKKGTTLVDNAEPRNLTLSVASSNLSNTYQSGQPLGLASSGEDSGSGLRQLGDVAPLSLWYGSNPSEASVPSSLRENPFQNALVSIAPSDYANFTVPFPAVQRVRSSGELEGELNVWTLGVDRAGNAGAEVEALTVRSSIGSGLGGVGSGLGPLRPRLAPDVGSSEVGTPKNPYAGFTVLNYNAGGVVPQGIRDELEPGPLTLGGKLTEYGLLPSSGAGETGLYRLTLPDSDLRSSGDAFLDAQLASLSFLTRLADPISSVDPSKVVPVVQLNPATLWPNTAPADQNSARGGSYRYNLPAWSSRLPSSQQIGHLWNTVSSVGSKPYTADVSTGSVGSAAVALLVTNNHGFSSVQAKGVGGK